MKLSDDTVKILDNFEKINPSICLQAGKKIVTINNFDSVLATANIDEYLEYELPIANLRGFLQALTLFNDPDLVVNSHEYMTIVEDDPAAMDTKCNFYFGDKNFIHSPAVEELELQSPGLKFNIKPNTLAAVVKAASVFKLKQPKIVIYSEKDDSGHKVMFGVTDPNQPYQNTYNVHVGDWEGKDFRLFLRLDRMVFLPGEYEVSVEMGAESMAEFKNISGIDVTYWVSLDTMTDED